MAILRENSANFAQKIKPFRGNPRYNMLYINPKLWGRSCALNAPQGNKPRYTTSYISIQK